MEQWVNKFHSEGPSVPGEGRENPDASTSSGQAFSRTVHARNGAPGIRIFSFHPESQNPHPVSAKNAETRVGHPRAYRRIGAGLAGGSVRPTRFMDISWVTERIAVGGGIWHAENMVKVAEAGITHIIDMQIEFDDTPLAARHGIEVLWNPTDDDFEAKPAELFRSGVDFAER